MRADDEREFTEFAAGELPRLRRFAVAVCGDWHRGDDLVQGALERMYVAWPRTRDVTDRGAYLRTVLVRLAVDEHRRPWRTRERTWAEPPDYHRVDPTSSVSDRLDLTHALAGLTTKQRAVVVLRYLEQRPVAEVAHILGISEGTVKRQCHESLARLRTALADDEVGPTEQRRIR